MAITRFQDRSATTLVQQLHEESSTQKQDLGTRVTLTDGRTYVYAKNGAVALAAGTLVQASVPVANHSNKTIGAAAAIGDTSITVNVVTTAITANQYAGGFIHINDATGEGYAYKIKGHPAAAASATCVIDIFGTVEVALVANTSEYTLTAMPCNGVVVCPTTLTAPCIGLANRVVTASYYFWMQTGGLAAVLTNGTVVIGNPVSHSATTGGAIDAMASNSILQSIGVVAAVNATTEYSLVRLCIPGWS